MEHQQEPELPEVQGSSAALGTPGVNSTTTTVPATPGGVVPINPGAQTTINPGAKTPVTGGGIGANNAGLGTNNMGLGTNGLGIGQNQFTVRSNNTITPTFTVLSNNTIIPTPLAPTSSNDNNRILLNP